MEEREISLASGSTDGLGGTSAAAATELTALNADAFSATVPSILSSESRRLFNKERWNDSPSIGVEVLRSRATEPPTITAIAAVMQSSLEDRDAFNRVWTAFHEIIFKLSDEGIQYYRPALEELSTTKPSDPGIEASHYVAAASLRETSKDLIRYLDNSEAVWVPANKTDCIGERSLQQRVTTTEQMRPHVPELLEWLADGNWPPFRGCRKQLARFPEATVEPIRVLMETERGDGGWLLNLLDFVEECVPVGPLWETLRPGVQALVDDPKGDEDDWELADGARRWLATLDAWKAKTKDA
ncbi:hypothetical protein G7Z17_g10567 [Cylindrodendrum hubeiense]|uniref:DUF5071 domain-containing protein n=1 Tax=Cylindrodendrum hubeiense TaxID=595255 RepID=A0A9P5LC70_9HYPO|nr:hypothetical protein G7Z17_g10567 [Cylindrodendrum hubeiense]